MLNIKILLKNIDNFIKIIKNRISKLDINILLELYNDFKKIKFDIEFLQFKKKVFSKKFYLFKNNKINIFYLKKIIIMIKENIIFKIKKKKEIFFKLNKIMLNIPNIPDKDVPEGLCDNDNKIISNWGIIKKKKFNILDHVKFCEKGDNLNFNESILLSGSSFVIIKGIIALLYRSISQFMIDYHIFNNNYKEVYVPYIVKIDSLYNSGQLPKFENNIFYVYKKCDLLKNKFALIPTSEVSLINLFKNRILNKKDLPIKLVSNTPCFRAESISYGKNNKGIFRLNQFDKVELIQIVDPLNSMKYLEKLTYDAEKILRILNIPYRKVLLCTNSMSFSSCKTYDIEYWSPVNKKFLEISSCSNTSDFQSRRINVKYYDDDLKEKKFVHMINGSGLSIGRTLIAILENHQIDKGIVKVPKVLIKYMNGIKYINYNE